MSEDQERRTAARVAGLMFLILGGLAAFTEFAIRSKIVVPGDPALTAQHVLAAERSFRTAVAIDVAGGAGNALLAVALYVLLKSINGAVALLALCWRLGEAVILGHMGINSLVAIDVLHSSSASSAFTANQWIALSDIFLQAQGDEFGIGLVFYALGSMLFCYLLARSSFLPRVISWWGFVGSVLALGGTLAIISIPEASGFAPGIYVPVGLFEIVAGVWLVFLPLRT